MMFKKFHFLSGILAAIFLSAAAQAAESATPKKISNPESPAVLQNTPTSQDVPATSSKISNTANTQSPTASQTAATYGDVVASEPPPMESPDGLSTYNRVVYHFNDTLDRMFLKPVATLYNKLLPRPLHRGITNFFSNIDNIPTIVNDVLQIKIYDAFSDSWRLVVNSTIGILGFFDVGSRIGLKPHHEDFGLTMAHWGYKQSNYFVVPFFGPGTIRDVLGWPVDYFLFSIYPHISNSTVRYGMYAVGVVDRRSNLLQYQDVFEQVAVDRYAFMRNAYLQHRNYQIKENEQPHDAVPQ
jgi:phospholipid-binding lipoprotein MlaA